MLKKSVRSGSSPYLTWFEPFGIKKKKNQKSSSGKWLGLSVWRNDEGISPFWEKATFTNKPTISLKDFCPSL